MVPPCSRPKALSRRPGRGGPWPDGRQQRRRDRNHRRGPAGAGAHRARRFLITTATRAPSVHNTQPWRFRTGPDAVELWSDPRRKLRTDPSGREMLISCGAALFGLRLAVRSLGYWPVTQLLPDPARLRLLARVSIGAAAPATGLERQMLNAVPHRHTHRGPFAPGPLPPACSPACSTTRWPRGPPSCWSPAAWPTTGWSGSRPPRPAAAIFSPRARAEIRRWTRTAARMARDGIPATALASGAGRPAGRLPQRDFDLGRGIARLPSGGAPPPATAVLLTSGDRRADWLRAGQALHRVLLHAASQWVFASLHTQPLEDAAARDLIRRPARTARPSPDAPPARPRNRRLAHRPAPAR